MNKCDICPNYCDLNYDQTIKCQQNPIYDNEDRIYSTVISIEPIEKKPLYHFMPGSKTLSIGTLGCNLNCLNCENHSIAIPENNILVPTTTYTPEEIIQKAIDNEIESITWTYNEPTIHPKWIIKTSKIAKEYDIKTVLVSNGYTSTNTLKELVNYVDAVNIDIKSMDKDFYKEVCGGSLEPVLNSIEYYFKNKIHVEVSNLLIPDYNDNTDNIRKLISYISNISDKIPLHFIRFHPDYKLKNIKSTREKTIFKATDLAEYLGINYVYPDSAIAPSHKNNTYCKNCRHLLIERRDNIVKNHITNKGACPNCNHIADVVL